VIDFMTLQIKILRQLVKYSEIW